MVSLSGNSGKFRFYFWIHRAGNDCKIGPAIIVEIGKARPPAGISRLDAKSRCDRDVGKIRGSVVMKQSIRVARKMRFEDIQVAIQVVIANSYPHSCLFHTIRTQGDPAFQAFFRKGIVVAVEKQETGCRVRSHIDIGPAILIKSTAAAVIA